MRGGDVFRVGNRLEYNAGRVAWEGLHGLRAQARAVCRYLATQGASCAMGFSGCACLDRDDLEAASRDDG